MNILRTQIITHFRKNGIKSCVKPVTESFITVSIILSPIVVGRIILAAITLVSIRLSGVVRGYEPDSGLTIVEQRNKFCVGEDIEVFGPRTDYTDEIVREMYDENNNPIESAPHPQQIIKVKLSKTYPSDFILRKKKES